MSTIRSRRIEKTSAGYGGRHRYASATPAYRKTCANPPSATIPRYCQKSAARTQAELGRWNHLPIRYHSGAIHAKDQILVNDQFPNYEVRGEFQAPSAAGTWPAFWLTGAWSWPPESDILEFKGDTRNWFNTFRSASDVSSTIVNVSSPGSWHEYRVWMTKVNATDVDNHYYLDGQWRAVHRAAGFVGKPLWLIINLQMEGSSGNTGPTAETFYRARNVYVGRTRN